MSNLRKEKRKYRTKSGKIAMRSVMVAAQGKPAMRMKLNQGGPAKGGAARKGAILGAVVGALGGATVGTVGGAAAGAAIGHKAFHGAVRGTAGHYYNPLQDSQFMSAHGANMRRVQATGMAKSTARGAAVLGVAGTVAGAAMGAVTGYVAGRLVDRSRAGKHQSRSVLHSRSMAGDGPFMGGSRLRPEAPDSLHHTKKQYEELHEANRKYTSDTMAREGRRDRGRHNAT